MSGKRVYELARELGVDSKDLVSFLSGRGVDVKNHMSLVNEPAMGEARRRFAGKAQAPARPAGTAQGSAPSARGSQGAAGTRPSQGEPRRSQPGPARPASAGAGRSASPGERRPAGDGRGRPGTPAGRPASGGGRPAAAGAGRPSSGGGRPSPAGGRPGGGRPGYGGGRPGGGPGGRPGGGPGGRPGGRPGGGPGGRPGAGGGRPGPGGSKPGTARPAGGVGSRVGTTRGADASRGRRQATDGRGRNDDRDRQREVGGRPGPRRGRRRGPRTRTVAPEPVRQRPERIVLPDRIAVSELADKLAIPAVALIKSLMKVGIMASINQSIEFSAAEQVAQTLGVAVDRPQRTTADGRAAEGADEAGLSSRPPVVTVMGHVDHGKTTLLDHIRKTRVVEQEAGGITQHIGAYQVRAAQRRITFLDTPGHEAFTAMRARGAQVTDVAVLVVAADDGVMPQTQEAINHARAAQVPIIVAINKMDRPGADPERVKQQLAEHGLVPDDWGGETVCVPISALKGEGIDSLLEMILLVADMRDLKANPDRQASGVIVEARLDRGRGPVATVLVQNGTLHLGDPIAAGAVAGKVRAMLNDRGESVNEAGPATPVEVLGFDGVPDAGDLLEVLGGEREARQQAEAIASERQQPEAKGGVVTLSQLTQKDQGESKELSIVLKADVQGSLEAVRQALEKLSRDEARVSIIHGGVGAISEADVTLAQASDAVVIGFSVRPDAAARRAADRAGIEIRTYTIIYQAVDDVQAALAGMLEPEFEERVIGQASVRQVFHVPGGTVAGCYVTEGEIRRNAKARLLRDGAVVHDGVIGSLRRFKDDVRSVSQGYECGIAFEKYQDVKEGDVIEAYQNVAVAARA